MMITDALRKLISGVLLLATTTTTTTLPLQQAGARSLSDSSTTVTATCAAELSACSSDETCTSCATLSATSSAEFDACADAVTSAGVDTSTAYCFSAMATVCCLDEASGNECLENGIYAEYWVCVLEDIGCSVDEITCQDEPEGSVGPSSAASSGTSGQVSNGDDGLLGSSSGASATVGHASNTDDGSESSVVLRAGTSAASGDDLSDPCAAERIACEHDETCNSCLTWSETTRSEVYYSCAEGVSSGGDKLSSGHCSGFMAEVCCLDEASEEECTGNDPFVVYWLCEMEADGCSADAITCDDDGGSLASRSGATTATVGHSSTIVVTCGLMVLLAVCPGLTMA